MCVLCYKPRGCTIWVSSACHWPAIKALDLTLIGHVPSEGVPSQYIHLSLSCESMFSYFERSFLARSVKMASCGLSQHAMMCRVFSIQHSQGCNQDEQMEDPFSFLPFPLLRANATLYFVVFISVST